MAMNNVPPAVIQKQAGHSSLEVTKLYLHVEEDFMVEQVRKAAEQKEAAPERKTEEM